MTAADRTYGPRRKIVRVLRQFTSQGRYGSAARHAREQVRLSCGHERAWPAGKTHARCGQCRPGRKFGRAPRRPVFKTAAQPRQVLAPEQALHQYDRLIQKWSWKVVRQLPPTSVFSQDDLYQEGVVITLRSLAKYKPQKAAFITYLYVSLQNRYGQILKREWAQAQGLPRASLERLDAEGEAQPVEIPALPEQEAQALLAGYRCACPETSWYRERGLPVPYHHSCQYVEGRNEDLAAAPA